MKVEITATCTTTYVTTVEMTEQEYDEAVKAKYRGLEKLFGKYIEIRHDWNHEEFDDLELFIVEETK